MSLLLLLLSCQTETPAAPTTCAYDFEATITEGPSAGTSLVGTLRLADLSSLEAGGAYGELEVSEDERYMVSATVDEQVELWFVLADGSMIHGVGDMPSTIGDCVGAEVEGSAEGPAEGDVGDWYAVGSNTLTCELTCQCGTAETAQSACENSCSLAGLDLSSAEGQSCVSTCSANLPLNCTCTTTRIGSQVSTFFGACG